ncbi:MAG: ATP-binding protein [Candidatus Hydrogenedentota bacterium]
MIKNYIHRKYYQDKITPFIDKNIIKVIIGQRRVGKSYILYQIFDTLKQTTKNNIIYINKELNEFDSIKTHTDLLRFINTKSKKNKKNYILIDEIQDINQFEKALRDLIAKNGYDIYCTGTNATMLSGELAGTLSGRYIEIPIYSLSYPEFLLFHKLENNTDTFFKYLKYGGLPYLINLTLEDDIIYEYLRNIYNTILFKDIVNRYNIRNINFLENLVKFLASNIGNLITAKKISDYLKSQKINISVNIVLNYLSYLQNAYFIFKIPRYDIRGRKIFEINDKYYFEDLGLRHILSSYSMLDINKVLENIVFMHLKIKGYKIFVGKYNGREIDFICEKNSKKVYIQVTYLIPDDKVIQREFGGLAHIPDNYPKYVLSMDPLVKGDYHGIEHLSIIDFLSNF